MTINLTELVKDDLMTNMDVSGLLSSLEEVIDLTEIIEDYSGELMSEEAYQEFYQAVN